MSNLNRLINSLNCDMKDYKSIPFWSWNNELDENELVKQIYDMKVSEWVDLLFMQEQD